MAVLAITSQLALHTRCENQIANEINRGPIRYGDQLQAHDFETEYGVPCIHRPVQPSRKYNCHGLTFASRRTWIEAPAEIAKIIKDDEYEEVPFDRVLAGDIAVYYVDGDAEHSGLVVSVNDLKVPIVLSKWGACHEVVHPVAQSRYDASNVKYYRITA
jgi:hypothetical protein